MSDYFRIHSVGDSLITFLRNTYPEPLRGDYPCDFRLMSSGEMAEADNLGTTVSLYLYRVEIDKHTRNAAFSRGGKPADHALCLALHYLLIVWADSALAEHTITAWAMSRLHRHPIFDQSNLSGSGHWGPGDQVHIVPMELSNEDLMQLWDVLTPNYRLSLPYIARVVRIEPEAGEDHPPVVATRYGYGDIEPANETD
ncbi:DUF4255 domain-containing protein [Desulfatitalea alkaliphila]|uniref:DUF4255 domain-containing protein n=1 Tax=Desulfatitalea alkaliphila TaxID=2929485 RepID=A0AA41UII0_9BACT|nr:DUF4255 domain-containing protein [Desulfatitalea alkaliphila]MCJ8500114.1 DUF4255 domain-containing protein [Desulfatitalea alkaliphila]